MGCPVGRPASKQMADNLRRRRQGVRFDDDDDYDYDYYDYYYYDDYFHYYYYYNY